MPQPTFRLQRSVRADTIRPGAHLVIDDEIVLLDEFTIGREFITLACFPDGRTDGRRKLVHVGLDAYVHEVPSTVAQLERAISELLDGRRGDWRDDTLIIELDEWTVRVDGAPKPAAPMPVFGLVDEEAVDAFGRLAAGGIVPADALTLVEEG